MQKITQKILQRSITCNYKILEATRSADHRMMSMAAIQRGPTHTSIRDWLKRRYYVRTKEYHATVRREEKAPYESRLSDF